MRDMTAEVVKRAHGVSMGYYSEVVSYGHTLARPGEPMELRVQVLSLHAETMDLASMGQFGGSELVPIPEHAAAEPGSITTFTYQFTMPEGNTVFEVWSYYWTGTKWQLDDYKQLAILVQEAAAPQVSPWLAVPILFIAGLGIVYAVRRRKS